MHMKQTLIVVQRFYTDQAFRTQVLSNPDVALAGYGLSREERDIVERELRQTDATSRPGKPIAAWWS
jgi:hypothetical protein